ncbi:MAG: hypothetical protein QOG56_752 [Solirubrobacteraceae bacterium]|jgi:hypothetical protein|nr:hypothetical protein [Solirubrobacteraceae bacterium]
MRTTLTLDDDVAAALARRRAERGTGLRHEINELLRAGLVAARDADAESAQPYELPTFDPGRALITDPRALKDLLDDEDDARSLPERP